MFDIVNDLLLTVSIVVLAFLFLGIVTFVKWKQRERWRPIDEAPTDKTLVLLKVVYHSSHPTPLFSEVDERRDRLYYGDTYVTIGYKKQDSDHRTWCAVGLSQDKATRFVHHDVLPTHFKPYPKPHSTSSH